MRKLIWLALFTVVSTQSWAALHPIEMVPLGKMPFSTVEVTLKGYGTTKMIVDTGASETVLAEWFAKETKLPLLPDPVEGENSGGSKFKARRSISGSLEIGRNTQFMSNFFVVPTPEEFKIAGIGGIFSPQTFFEDKTLLLDFSQQRILGGKYSSRWVRGKKKIDRVKIYPCAWDRPNKYVLDLSLNGVVGRFYLDTGGLRSAITRDFKAKIGDVKGTKGERTGLGAKRKVERLQGLSLKVGKIRAQVTADVEPERVACPTADGKLGNDFLSQYSLLFDKKRQTITFYR